MILQQLGGQRIVKCVARIIGLIVTAICFFYLWQILQEELSRTTFDVNARLVFVSILICVSGIGGYSIFALSWCWLLRARYPTLAWRFSLRILGLSQIGKYLPGNVVHMAGRAVLARRFVQPLDITYSFVIESLLLVASHATIGVLQLGYIVGLTTMQAAAGSLILVFTCPLGLVVIVRWITKRFPADFQTYVKVFGMLLLLALINGAALWLLLWAQHLPLVSPLALASSFALAFVAGFVLPGAPGGLGVREAVFVWLMQDWLPQHEALRIVVLFRVISIASDVILFLIAQRLKPQAQESESSR